MTISKFALAAALFGSLATGAVYAQSSGTTLTDETVVNEVEQQIDHHTALQFDRLRVQAINHVVYLYGTVDTDAESAFVEALARQEPGVAKVVNLTTVTDAGG